MINISQEFKEIIKTFASDGFCDKNYPDELHASGDFFNIISYIYIMDDIEIKYLVLEHDGEEKLVSASIVGSGKFYFEFNKGYNMYYTALLDELKKYVKDSDLSVNYIERTNLAYLDLLNNFFSVFVKYVDANDFREYKGTEVKQLDSTKNIYYTVIDKVEFGLPTDTFISSYGDIDDGKGIINSVSDSNLIFYIGNCGSVYNIRAFYCNDDEVCITLEADDISRINDFKSKIIARHKNSFSDNDIFKKAVRDHIILVASKFIEKSTPDMFYNNSYRNRNGKMTLGFVASPSLQNLPLAQFASLLVDNNIGEIYLAHGIATYVDSIYNVCVTINNVNNKKINIEFRVSSDKKHVSISCSAVDSDKAVAYTDVVTGLKRFIDECNIFDADGTELINQEYDFVIKNELAANFFDILDEYSFGNHDYVIIPADEFSTITDNYKDIIDDRQISFYDGNCIYKTTKTGNNFKVTKIALSKSGTGNTCHDLFDYSVPDR